MTSAYAGEDMNLVLRRSPRQCGYLLVRQPRPHRTKERDSVATAVFDDNAEHGRHLAADIASRRLRATTLRRRSIGDPQHLPTPRLSDLMRWPLTRTDCAIRCRRRTSPKVPRMRICNGESGDSFMPAQRTTCCHRDTIAGPVTGYRLPVFEIIPCDLRTVEAIGLHWSDRPKET